MRRDKGMELRRAAFSCYSRKGVQYWEGKDRMMSAKSSEKDLWQNWMWGRAQQQQVANKWLPTLRPCWLGVIWVFSFHKTTEASFKVHLLFISKRIILAASDSINLWLYYSMGDYITKGVYLIYGWKELGNSGWCIDGELSHGGQQQVDIDQKIRPKLAGPWKRTPSLSLHLCNLSSRCLNLRPCICTLAHEVHPPWTGIWCF